MVTLSYNQLDQLLSIGREITRMEQRIGKHVSIPYEEGYVEGPVISESFDEIVVQDEMYGFCRIPKPCTIEENPCSQRLISRLA